MKLLLIMLFSLIQIFSSQYTPTMPTITTTSFQTEKNLPNNITHITYVTNSYQNNVESFHSYYSYPSFPPQFPQAEKLNYFYQNQFFKDFKKIQEIRNNANSVTLSENTVCAYDHTFEVQFLSHNFLSILENTYTYCGGLHADSVYEAHTFSLKNGSELKLENLLLGSVTDIEKKIKESIINSIKAAPDDFFPDAIEIVHNMPLDSFHFYINQNGIIIFFNTYEITPYAKGYVEFNIPI